MMIDGYTEPAIKLDNALIEKIINRNVTLEDFTDLQKKYPDLYKLAIEYNLIKLDNKTDARVKKYNYPLLIRLYI